MTDKRLIPNPFDSDVVPDADRPALIDVAIIHRNAFDKCRAVYQRVSQHGYSWSALLFGESGCGKTHLLSRFRRWLSGGVEPKPETEPGSFIAVQMQSGPGHVWRHVRRRMAEEARRPLPGGLTRLDHTLSKFAASAGGDLERAFGLRQIRDLDRNLREVLLSFADGRHRRLCCDWLAGDSLTEAEHALLNVAVVSADGIDEDLAEYNARRVVLALTRLHAPDPVVFCFDQVEALTLSQQQKSLASFSRMGTSLVDETENSVVISTVLARFLRDLEDASPSDYIRIAKERLDLQRLNEEQANKLIEARLASVPEIKGESPISKADVRAFVELSGGSCNPRALIHHARGLFSKWQQIERPARSVPEVLTEEFDRLWTSSSATTNSSQADAVLNHGVPALLKILGHVVEERPVKGIDFALQVPGGPKVMVAYGNQADMRSYGPWLARVTKQAGGAPLYVLRDARLSISESATATHRRLEELTNSGGRDVRVDVEALAALDAMRVLLSRAKSGDLSCEGDSIPYETVSDWLKANLPRELLHLASEIAGESPTGEKGAQPLDALVELLNNRKLVRLDEAAKLTGYSQEQIESYARSHPDRIHLFGGLCPVVCRVVAPAAAAEQVYA